MRQRSFFVRRVGVCLLSILFSLNAFAQTDKITEGSLRVVDAGGSERGLCPLKQTDVRAEISGMLSRVTVTQTFQNPSDEKIEAVYTFPLPNDAAVDDMTIQIGERFIKSRIMESARALETYQQAIKEGKTAALLEQQRPNVFTQSVGNIPPAAEIKVVISYVETLKYADGTYEFAFPMTVSERYIPLPKTIDPASSSETGVRDEAKISPARTTLPLHRVSLEVKIDAGVSIENLASNTHEIETQAFSASRFFVRLRNEDELPNRDFVMKFKTAGEKIEDALLAHRDARGGFFTLVLQPPDRIFPADATAKEIVFVLDTSGSMDGFPIEKAREAMMLTLNGLNPQDTFNLITFAGDTQILFDQPVPATPENLRKAKEFLASRKSSGGTEMMKAIKAALDPSDSQEHIRVVCFMTDGLVANEFEIIDEVKNHPNARVFAFGIGSSVNRFLLDEIAREGRGEVEYVLPGDDGSAAARRFHERVRSPLLTDISIDWNGLPVDETLPARLPDLFDAKPVVVAGRYAGGASGKIVLHGKMHGQVVRREIDVVLPETSADHDVLATLWARRKISALMRQDLTGLQRKEFKDDVKQAITALGVEFRLLTQFTSFVAVDEQTITENGVPRRVEVPVIGQTGVDLPINGRRMVNYAMLSPGASSSVTVSASSSVVDTTETRLSSSISTQTSSALGQTRGNGFQNLLSTATGITQVGESPLTERRGLVSSNGQQPTSNNFTVDGLPANLGVSLDESSLSRNAGRLPALTASGGTNSFTTSGQLQEIVVKTLGAAREQRVPGADINIVSSSGSNNFRGSLFEIFGNEKLNANDPFAKARGLARPASRLNQFGGALGGFIRKDKVWFFGGYEGLRLRQAGFNVSEVPTFISRGIMSGNFRPLLRAFPVGTSEIGTSNGFAEFAAAYTNPATHDIFGLRIDVQPMSKLRLGARYNFADSTAQLRGDRDFSLNTVRRLDAETGSFVGGATYTATPNIVINGRFGLSRNRLGQQFTLDAFGGAEPFALDGRFDFLKYDFAGKNAALAAGDPIRASVDQFAASGAFDWVRGNHQLTFGAEFRRLALEPGAARAERSVLFSRTAPLSGITTARVVELSREPLADIELNNFSVFAQHGWRINSRLNLNLGVRWDADFAPGTGETNISYGDASLRMPGRLSNFAPRAGLAFDIGGGKGVIRANTGLYFDYAGGAASDAFVNSFPFAAGRYALNAPFTATPTAPLRPLALFDDGLQTPRAWHSSVEYQQEIFYNHIFSAGYTYSAGRQLFLTRTLLGVDPDFNYIRLTNNDARSDFSALELRFERRYSQGFSFNARYALSKSKDNYSPDTLRETNFPAADLERERGSSDFEARHQLSVYGVYDLPSFFAGGWAKRLTDDWTLSAFANARTGYPVNVGYLRANIFGKEFVRADRVAGVPVYLDRDKIKRLNPDAFALPAAGAQGSLKRNSLRGFPLFQLDASLQRRIRFTNEMRLELAVSAFNLLNRTNYADMSGILGTQFSDSTLVENEYFGRATNVFGGSNFTPFYLYGGARTIQLSAKFVF